MLVQKVHHGKLLKDVLPHDVSAGAVLFSRFAAQPFVARLTTEIELIIDGFHCLSECSCVRADKLSLNEGEYMKSKTDNQWAENQLSSKLFSIDDKNEDLLNRPFTKTLRTIKSCCRLTLARFGTSGTYAGYLLRGYWVPDDEFIAGLHNGLKKLCADYTEFPSLDDLITSARTQCKFHPTDVDRPDRRKGKPLLPQAIGNKAITPKSSGTQLTLLLSNSEIHDAQLEIVRSAKRVVATTGSWSYNTEYFKAIERRLIEDNFRYYRVLVGLPRNKHLAAHLRAVAALRELDHHVEGVRSLCLALADTSTEPERLISANETMAVIPLPSVHEFRKYDTALLIRSNELGEAYCHFVHQYWTASQIICSKRSLEKVLDKAGFKS